MKDLVRSFGKGLTTLFVAAVLGWALVLIILPQLAMLEMALTKPVRQLDSSIVGSLERDAASCVNILGQYAEPDTPASENGRDGGAVDVGHGCTYVERGCRASVHSAMRPRHDPKTVGA